MNSDAINNMPQAIRFDDRLDKSLYQKRKFKNKLGIIFTWSAMIFGLFWLAWILVTLFGRGAIGFAQLPIFTANTPPPATIGGLKNAIVGSILLAVSGLAMGVPIGVMAGIYLAEFADNDGKFGQVIGKVTRFLNDILLSAPSIVIGLFVYALMVSGGRGFSGWAGAVALALIVIPVVVRTTENMLSLVPNALRESAYALGTPKYKLVGYVTLKSAKAGVLTGILLAFARITGETAPLLFTALNNLYFSMDMSQTIANLPNTIYQFSMNPDATWNQLAWSAALLITLAVLSLNILARFIGAKESS